MASRSPRSSGLPSRTHEPIRRSLPSPVGLRGTSASSRSWASRWCSRRAFVASGCSSSSGGGGAEQYSLVVRSAMDDGAAARVLVDPSTASADAATAIDWFFPSADGRLVAYGLSEGGTEHSTLAVLDVVDGTHRADRIANTRAATVAWLPDSTGFYYTSYPEGDQYNRRVMFHQLGTAVDADAVVWSDPAAPQSWPDVQVSPDG
ncbi:MAG TPA: hypothetical protein VGM78_16115, partial [Ilumatobacteraceae bacterium]